MEQVLKNFFLFLSKSRTMQSLAKKYGLRFGASRFVAGETLEQAVKAVKELNRNGLDATIDHLGEFVTNEKEAKEQTDYAIKAIKAIGEEEIHSQLSLKLTSVGLDLSEQLVMENMRRILNAAQECNVFVTMDMEDYSRCQKTIALFKGLRKEYQNIGTVLQAYLYRALKDAEELSDYSSNLRLVKGAYKESAKVAFPDKEDVNENYKKLIEKHLLTGNGNYTAIASHDEEVIQFTKNLVKRQQIPKHRFEFQMLYGIRPERQLELVKEGFRMRVYVPFGTDWYGYFMRRLAERPANAMFVLKTIIKK